MGFALRVEGLDTGECIELEDEALVSIEYRHNTVDSTKARSTNMEYVLNIGERISPFFEKNNELFQQSLLKTIGWAHLPYAPETDYYRKVSIVYEKEEQIVRELNFSKAYVLNYIENYDDQNGMGTFQLVLGQKKDELEKINFGEDLQADTNVEVGNKIERIAGR